MQTGTGGTRQHYMDNVDNDMQGRDMGKAGDANAYRTGRRGAAFAAALCAALAASPVPPAHAAPETPAGQAADAARSITVPLRGQQLLALQGAPLRVAIADPAVADAKVLARPGGRGELMLLGKAPGSTDLHIWLAGGGAPLHWRLIVSGEAQSALDDAAVQPAESGMVQVEVKVVELSRSVMKDVGIRLGAGGSGPWSGGVDLLPSTLLGSGFGLSYISRNFNATLGLLESTGMARILAEPTLVAMSGQNASFLAGGEIPVPQAGGLGVQSVTYKPFGIGLTVAPTVLSRDRIALKVAPEASELDYANSVPVINGDSTTMMPALRTRRADTMVELGDGESFVVSGLVSRQTIANVDKIPLLGDLPIIGSFFRSIQYSQEDRELVIVVTPRLVRPIARGVALPLPGDREEVRDTPGNVWGYYLTGPAGGQQMPGFSR